MTLTQQFLIVTFLPLTFLGLAVYLWRQKTQRQVLATHWILTLVVAAVWASSVLRYYGGVTMPLVLTYNWAIIGRYAFVITAVLVLMTTIRYLTVPRQQSQLAVGLSAFLALLAVGTDPEIWPNLIGTLTIADQSIRQFDLWAAIWITSWLLPVLGAWLLTQQVNARLTRSLYRNQIHYWLLVLTLFFFGGVLNSIHDPGSPVWHEIAILVVIVTAVIGTYTLTNTQLPDLQLATRRLLSQLSGTLIIFGLTWLALFVIVQIVATLPPTTSPSLILILAAALFAGLFTLIFQRVTAFTRRLFLPVEQHQELAVSEFMDALGGVLPPERVGALFLQVVAAAFEVDNAGLFVVEDAPGGQLVLRPLAITGSQPAETIDFAAGSPFTQYLRENQQPLVQFDIESLRYFASMPEREKDRLEQWQRVLYVPMHMGDRLVAVLMMGAKYTGEPYDRHDFDEVQQLSQQLMPWLIQAQNQAHLQRLNNFAFSQNQQLARERQHLRHLADLYGHFIRLITPDLRRPLASIEQSLHQLRQHSQNGTEAITGELTAQVDALKTPIDSLIHMSSRILVRDKFYFEPVRIDELAQQEIRNLRTMAEARRVRVNLETSSALPMVYGDRAQLQDAIHHLLHNAIKFNKIGGTVQMECGVLGADVYLRVIDTGVGIPEERLKHVWDGVTQLRGTGTRRVPGVGMALVHFIVSAHGGRVDAQSVYGSGSVFSMHLPMIMDDEAEGGRLAG
ncbi:MAG: hypothetical protein Kow0080_12320 [Candidatus Promineifilaceae bacterium]